MENDHLSAKINELLYFLYKTESVMDEIRFADVDDHVYELMDEIGSLTNFSEDEIEFDDEDEDDDDED